MAPGAAPLIVTAELAAPDQHRLDTLRKHYFPPERNQLPAHLTMFHALPPSVEDEAKSLLASLARSTAPKAEIDRPYSLGQGVALRIRSEELEALRSEIAEHFHGMLTLQDAQGWRPHITIQNKVTPDIARRTLADVEREFRPGPIRIIALALHRYMGGPWEAVARYPFRG